jgi:Ni/Co efflux regulator RcnB
MRKMMIALALASTSAGATLAASPAAAQSYGQQYRGQQVQRQAYRQDRQDRQVRQGDVRRHSDVRQNANRGYGQAHAQQRRWNRGERFDRRQAANYRVIQRHERLYAAPRGHQWVQSGNDAVLIGITSGIVSALLSNLF